MLHAKLIRYSVVLATAAVLAACACRPPAATLSGHGSSEQDQPCVDIRLDGLPLSESALFAKVFELTGYTREQLTIERICAYKDEYLFAAYPTTREKEFQRSFLIVISKDGSASILPSM